ncbi:MAG: peptidase M14 [Maribacter sp.]|nr:peptidase M14 [Maribacter sp.]
MKMPFLTLLGCIIIAHFGFSQESDLTSKLYTTYVDYKEEKLTKRRTKHQDLQPLIAQYNADSRFKVNKVGESIEGRDLNLISVGTGMVNAFLWSQMHGNEPTATQAIFDILNFLGGEDFQGEKKEMLENLTIHFLPMLNPDGAERYQRRNLLGVDINRDALRLQSPESRTLKRVRDSLDADFGFNLHDQSTYYNAELTEKPATISYLAPAFNYEKEISEKRGNAMKIIAFMNRIIQKYASGQVGRYNDDFEPRAFGDNIQKWGTSTILIESGGYANDVEKQEIRKLNYVSILSALYTIAKGNYVDIPIEEYDKIPENDRKLFDLKMTNVTHNLLGKDYLLDLGINRLEVDKKGNDDFWYSSRIIDQGDLSTYFGYETFNASGYTIMQGKVHPQIFQTIGEVMKLKPLELLKEGYTFVRVKDIPFDQLESPLPLHIIGSSHTLPEFHLEVGRNPTFLLEKEGKAHYAVINGFLINLTTGEGQFKNAMIYR